MALLVVRDRLGIAASGQRVLTELEPFAIKVEAASEWPGTTLVNGSAQLWTVRYVSATAAILSSSAAGLYDWQQPGLPEDLCLLRDQGDPFLVSIAHERDAYVVLSEDEHRIVREEFPAFAANLRPDTNG